MKKNKTKQTMSWKIYKIKSWEVNFGRQMVNQINLGYFIEANQNWGIKNLNYLEHKCNLGGKWKLLQVRDHSAVAWKPGWACDPGSLTPPRASLYRTAREAFRLLCFWTLAFSLYNISSIKKRKKEAFWILKNKKGFLYSEILSSIFVRSLAKNQL